MSNFLGRAPAPFIPVKRENFPEKAGIYGQLLSTEKAERETERRWERRERAMPNREMALRKYVLRSKGHIGTSSNMT
jgi:hypothetical protein